MGIWFLKVKLLLSLLVKFCNTSVKTTVSNTITSRPVRWLPQADWQPMKIHQNLQDMTFAALLLSHQKAASQRLMERDFFHLVHFSFRTFHLDFRLRARWSQSPGTLCNCFHLPVIFTSPHVELPSTQGPDRLSRSCATIPHHLAIALLYIFVWLIQMHSGCNQMSSFISWFDSVEFTLFTHPVLLPFCLNPCVLESALNQYWAFDPTT